MMLGEALSLRAKQAQRLNELRQRIVSNVMVQEGDEPAENIAELIDSYMELNSEHFVLISRIALTNAQTVVEASEERERLVELLHRREMEGRERAIYKQAADSAVIAGPRWGRSEIKFVSLIDVPQYRLMEAAADERLRQLDALIQETNWQTELAE